MVRSITLISLLGPTVTSASFQETLCASIKVPGFCPSSSTSDDGSAASSSSDPCETSPESCCQDSTCSSMPGFSCWAKRGDTNCVGQSLLPPSMGKCQCESGYCGSDGVCTPSQSSIERGASGSTFTGQSWTTGSSSRLYEQHGEAVPPEDHGRVILAYAIVFAGMVAASVALAKRLSTRGRQRELRTTSADTASLE